MKPLKPILYLTSCWFSLSCLAETMNPSQVLSLTVSNKGITRLSVEGDPIREMFLYPDNLQEFVTLHKSGHLFLSGENIDRELFLSLITDKGEVQDIKIRSASMPSHPIILNPQHKKEEVSRKEIERWLKDFAEGLVPEEFERAELQERQRPVGLLDAFAQDRYLSKTHEVTVFGVTNTLKDSVVIETRALSKPGEGVYALKTLLKPKEITRIVIIKKK